MSKGIKPLKFEVILQPGPEHMPHILDGLATLLKYFNLHYCQMLLDILALLFQQT